MNCWKCGDETPNGEVECDDCALPAPKANATTSANSIVDVIDWDKVKTFEELKEILTAFGFQVLGGPGTQPYDKLRRFLKD